MASDDEVSSIKSRIDSCFMTLNKYSWLLDSYVLDFFVDDHWKTLPKSWRTLLESIPLNEFCYLMNFTLKPKNVWPLSLLCLRAVTQYFQLSRNLKESNKYHFIVCNKINFLDLNCFNSAKSVCFEHVKVRNYLFKNVKPKKRYEILKMATIAADTAMKLNVKNIVDVGSGLGHLSRIMAYGFNLNVCSIETEALFIKQAEVLDCEFEEVARKYLNVANITKPVHLNQRITWNLPPDEFVKRIKKAFSINEEKFQLGIIGLHPCGDLATVLLKLYITCPEIRFINIVGCCYHKLTSSSDWKNSIGFPMSNFAQIKKAQISYEGKSLACHALEIYRTRLKSNDHDHLKIHCYRAALENIINKNWPKIRKSCLANVKYKPNLTFNQYCQTALKKLNLVVTEKDLNSAETLRNLSLWENVVKFYSLRLMLAPLIETVILLDRQLYLLEKGLYTEIKTAFDPEISPRNQLLISFKH